MSRQVIITRPSGRRLAVIVLEPKYNMRIQYLLNCKMSDKKECPQSKKAPKVKKPGGGGLPYETDGDARRLA